MNSSDDLNGMNLTEEQIIGINSCTLECQEDFKRKSIQGYKSL